MPYKMVLKSQRRKVMKRKQYKRKAAVPSVSPTVQSYVKRMLAVKTEDKIPASVNTLNDNVNNMFGATFGTVISLSDLWNISQGTGQGDRIGNSITPKSWRFKGFFSLDLTSPLTLPCIVKMYILKYKNNFNAPTGSSATFYENGNTTIAPAGTFMDILRTPNRDLWTVYTTRSFKIGPSTVSYGTPGTVGNNDFKSICPFNIDVLKYQKHAIKYQDASTSPTNSGLHVVFAIAPSDGSASNGGTNVNLPNINYEISGSFEDA